MDSRQSRKRRDPSVCNPSVFKIMKEHRRNRTLDRKDVGIQRALPVFCQDHQGAEKIRLPKNVLTTFPLKFAKGMVKKVQVWPPPSALRQSTSAHAKEGVLSQIYSFAFRKWFLAALVRSFVLSHPAFGPHPKISNSIPVQGSTKCGRFGALFFHQCAHYGHCKEKRVF